MKTLSEESGLIASALIQAKRGDYKVGDLHFDSLDAAKEYAEKADRIAPKDKPREVVAV